MDIHIHIDDRIPVFFRRVFRRPKLVALIGVLATAGVVYAAESITYIAPGAVLSSSHMNDILNDFNDRIEALESSAGRITGYEVVQADGELGPNTRAGMTATCPLGKKPVGGGFWVADPHLAFGTSIPLGDGWHAEAYNSTPDDVGVRTYVVCVNAEPPLSGP